MAVLLDAGRSARKRSTCIFSKVRALWRGGQTVSKMWEFVMSHHGLSDSTFHCIYTPISPCKHCLDEIYSVHCHGPRLRFVWGFLA